MESNVVSGRLTIEGQGDAAEPLSTGVRIETRGECDLARVVLVMTMETGTVWELDLAPGAAAYLGGALAIESGVTFGRS